MSKERQRRRADRERQAEIAAAHRQALAQKQAKKQARRAGRRQALKRLLPAQHSRQSGPLAQRRRQQVGATIALLAVVNVLVWVFWPDWSARAMALIVSLLAAPVVHTLLFGKS
ncbi:hypothetical protein [Nocardioides sp.]|uniref:hypothetical protein n=1 Tax=Nocardioides sp. TaxID=35761 RepID=UPI0035656C7C